MLPGIALLFCLAGLLGLYLPLLEGSLPLKGVSIEGLDVVRAAVDELDLSFAAIAPGLCVLLTVIFLAFSALPLVDLMTGRVRLTGLLAMPTAIALIPMAVLAGTLISVADTIELLAGVLPDDIVVVGVGSGTVLLIVAEFGLVAVSAAAIVTWARARRRRTVDPEPLVRPPRPIGEDFL